MDKILVTGAKGMLGCTLVPTLLQSGFSVVTHSRGLGADYSFDLLNRESLFQALSEIQPNVIVNLVGLTSVELCQEQPNIAYQVNTKSVENLVDWIESSEKDCFLVQISTDQVYDGVGPHKESSVNLSNNYAFSKYGGELAALRVKSSILRTNFVGLSKSPLRESLTDWIYRSLKKGSRIEVLDDVYFNPLSMITLSKLVGVVIKSRLIGVFNLGSRGGMSKADFDFLFADLLNLPSELMKKIGVSDASFLKAYRPKDMRTDVSKFESLSGMQMPALSDEIERAANDYHETFQ